MRSGWHCPAHYDPMSVRPRVQVRQQAFPPGILLHEKAAGDGWAGLAKTLAGHSGGPTIPCLEAESPDSYAMLKVTLEAPLSYTSLWRRVECEPASFLFPLPARC
jgi:hypothetical protein